MKNAKQRYTGIFASLMYIERKNQLLRAQQYQEGDTDNVTVYLFLAKTLCRFSKLPKVYRGFSASLRYIERKYAIEGTTKRRGGYQYAVYCHGIPLSGKTYDVTFHPVLVLEDVCFL